MSFDYVEASNTDVVVIVVVVAVTFDVLEWKNSDIFILEKWKAMVA